jgi:hypothetical protein
MNALKVALLTVSIFVALIASVIALNPRAKTSETNAVPETAAVATSTQAIASSAPTPVNPVSPPTVAVQQSMSVEQAYQRIPHAKTTFSVAQTQAMNAAESQSANELFQLVDSAIVERVMAMDNVQRGQPYSSRNYDAILARLNSLAVPEKLAAPRSLISAAINDQKSYFERLNRDRKSQSLGAQDPLIQSAHQKLFTAYNRLMGVYPQESAYNKKAFFDHLCALDFV